MKPKKNPKADWNRYSGLFFTIGLIVATSISLFAINYRTVLPNKQNLVYQEIDDLPEVDITNVNVASSLPPPPKEIAPVLLKVVNNEQDTPAIIESTEDTPDAPVPSAPIINTTPEEPLPDGDIPFILIEDKPMFDNCKGLPKGKQQDDCFKQSLDKHVQKHFQYPQTAIQLGLQGRVHVNFRINKDGSISVIDTHGSDEILQAEARRIIEKLPRLIPGKQRNQTVSVTYSYPIKFRLSN